MLTTLCKPRTLAEWLAGSLVWAIFGGYSWVAMVGAVQNQAASAAWLCLAAGAAWQGWLGWRLAAGGWPVLHQLRNGWLEMACWLWLLGLLLGLLFAQALALELVLPAAGGSLFDSH